MAEEKTRVDFNAPASLVERADRVVDVLDISRTRLLIEALEDELEEIADDDEFRRRLGDAYYADQVDFETVESIVGREEALRMKLLKESIDREPLEPTLADDLPSDEAFYDGPVPEWIPDEESDDDGPP
jgi:hypothetical protein